MTIILNPARPRPTAVSPARVRAGVGYGPDRTRRALQLALAALWLLDSALQFQPYMFTRGFVTDTLAPAAQGNPGLVSAPMDWVNHLVAGHPLALNAAFATIQLAIAAGLVWRRTVKASLAASVVWALGVWWFGEGLGGVLTGASPVMGAPGAVLLYALVAVLVWPRREAVEPGSLPGRSELGATIARLAWATLWGAMACLFLLPANRVPGGLHDAIIGMAGDQPGWLGGMDHHLAGVLAGKGNAASIVLGVVCDLIAVSIFIPRLRRAGLYVAAVIGALVWVAQGLGGIFTGRGTDPNSGPLLVLVAAAYWPMTSLARDPLTGGPHTIRVRTGAPPLRRTAGGDGLGRLRESIGATGDVSRWSALRFGSASRGVDVAGPPRSRAARVGVVRNRRVGLLAALGLLASGCVAGHGSTGVTAARASDGSMPAGMSMPAGTTMQRGMSMGTTAPPAAGSAASPGPSQSARMVCGSEIRRDVATALALPAPPAATATWSDHLYTCTYRLPAGPLVLAVKELNGVPAARVYFDRLRQRVAPTRPIRGLANLGLPGYQAATSGTVIFLKDDKTLEVDPRGLPSGLGPNRLSRDDFAYQLATDVLGCWTGK